MKKTILALAASAALMGSAYAQTELPPTATETESDATTVPAEEAAPVTGVDAPPSGEHAPTAAEPETNATTVTPETAPVLLPEGTDGPQSGPDAPTATETEEDATTVQPQ